ncbi:MAG: hypothetical protein JSR25_11430 [Proteobacteria bacterium]|nr:hypothetical protein [Pseudomonadota bacterium]
MAKNKRWNKLIARIQALEDALAGLLTGKSASGAKRGKAKKASAKPAAKSKRKAHAKKSLQKPAPKSARAKKRAKAAPKPRKKNLRAAVAENAPILPQPPIPSL